MQKKRQNEMLKAGFLNNAAKETHGMLERC